MYGTVLSDTNSELTPTEKLGRLEESELRSLYQAKYVKESQDKKTNKEMKEEYTSNYNLQSSLMTKASQGKTQSEQSMEANAKGIKSEPTNSIFSQLQSLFEKSGLDLLAISQKPEYLNKIEDATKLYTRFTFFQQVVGPQINIECRT
ncbi:hypothetical protein [Paenibacillus glacialis]|uniref:Uncharacterized protein n=1 Tax=Paenibacillus glacialis TaxID=494026 RepID=A0A168H3Z4_9BACL|nr:hypothetical protein [Paenibacillus glacialis]OAB37797.1 hypothetical protein PGLA_20720 [Paenibacillus glacialis]